MKKIFGFAPGFVPIIPLIIALAIVGGGFYGVYKIADVNPFGRAPAASPSPSPVNNPFPQASPSPLQELPKEPSLVPQDEGGPIKSDVTGQWHGRYTVTAPEACTGEEGGWTATLKQTGTAVSGNFESPAASGSVSGSAISGANISWSVGGGGGGVSFKGGFSSPNSVSGTFVGVVCDPEEAPQKTSGTFFGGRLVQ